MPHTLLTQLAEAVLERAGSLEEVIEPFVSPRNWSVLEDSEEGILDSLKARAQLALSSYVLQTLDGLVSERPAGFISVGVSCSHFRHNTLTTL